MSTAADDKLISPQSVPYQRGGGGALPSGRCCALPVVPAALDCVPPRYRAMLLLATFASLRFGELPTRRVRTMLSTSSATGASLRELMERMGHSSSRAAMIYQHGSRERDEAIAAVMGNALAGARKNAARPRSGTQRARGRGEA